GNTLGPEKFKNGDVKHYSTPQEIAQIPLGPPGEEWPRTFMATLLMIEKDEGDIGTVVNKVIDAIGKEVEMAVKKAASLAAAALAGATIGSSFPLVGTAVGAAVGVGVNAAFNAIKKSRADDVFPPKKVDWELG